MCLLNMAVFGEHGVSEEPQGGYIAHGLVSPGRISAQPLRKQSNK
jgi:hypothetical protein